MRATARFLPVPVIAYIQTQSEAVEFEGRERGNIDKNRPLTRMNAGFERSRKRRETKGNEGTGKAARRLRLVAGNPFVEPSTIALEDLESSS